MNRIAFVSVCFAVVCNYMAVPVHAKGQEKDGAGSREPWNISLLININDIFFDPESYGGGIGIKLGRDPLYLRLFADIVLANHAFSLGLGGTFERHLLSGRISPYWGVTTSVGIGYQKDEINQTDWSSITAIPLMAGGILGVEISAFDFLSFFIEYALSLELKIESTASSLTGNVTRNSRLEYNLNTGLGNESKIGVVIHLPVTLRSKTH